jgi:hypothetical protein
VENIASKSEISLGAVYSQLLAVEARLELQNSQFQSGSSVNSMSCGRGGGKGGGHGGFGCVFRGCGMAGSSSGTKPVCQLCKKTGHTVLRCWKHFDHNFTPEDKMANNAEALEYNVDPTWYSYTGATNHITNEMDKLVVREKYTVQEQIHDANGGGMQISHIGHSTLYTPLHNLSLKHVLHVPSTKKYLVFIHRFTRDNHVFVECHPFVFLVKNPHTKKLLLCGKCRGGIYPFPSLEQSTTKCVLVRSSRQ